MIIGQLSTVQKGISQLLTKESEYAIGTVLSYFDYKQYDFPIYVPNL